MNINRGRMSSWIFILGVFFWAGCGGGNIPNRGQMDIYRFPSIEAAWVQNGEPIEFEGELWYPTDGVENLLDSEVYLVGEYRGVQFFIEKTDIRPYDRLYTKFARNRFRYFQKKAIKP